MIQKISLQLNKYPSIQFLTISNSIPNTICFSQGKAVLSSIFGGMSGVANKYINFGVITLFRQYIKQENFHIIGCGGISNLNDIQEYFSCGASFVQVASCFYDEKTTTLNSNKIIELLKQFLSTLKKDR